MVDTNKGFLMNQVQSHTHTPISVTYYISSRLWDGIIIFTDEGTEELKRPNLLKFMQILNGGAGI